MLDQNTRGKRQPCPYRIMERLANFAFPDEGLPVNSADDLLRELVRCSDGGGRYYSRAFLLRRLCWWQDVSIENLRAWRQELIEREEIELKPLGRSIYTDASIDLIVIKRPRRFARFAPRAAIPSAVRLTVFDRDRNRCVWCSSVENLALDHIIPVSKGGSDSIENLQTLCRTCNCRKSNTDNEIAKGRITGVAA